MKKIVALLLAISMVATLFAGCGGSSSSGSQVSIVVGEEPKTLDPGTNNSLDGGIYVLHAFEGLTKVDKDGKTIAGIAEKWDISPDLKEYTFHLRKDTRWQDGQQVKASDFEYAWKRALDPKLASEYAYQLYYLKNGEEYNSGKASADDVGVKAVDDQTLKVTLKAPTAYFLDLLHFPTYMPVRKDIVDKYGEKWTQSPASYIGNGAYKMKDWKHNDVIVFEKSDSYYDKDTITMDTINFKLIADANVALTAFESDEIDATYDLVPTEEQARLEKEGKLQIFDKLGTYYLDLNIKDKAFTDVRVRKALSLAIDRKYIVENVTKAGEKPANAFVPYKVPGADSSKDFRSENTDKSNDLPETANVAEAKKLMAEAGYPDGKGFPEVEIIYNDTGNHKKIMEVVQEEWKKNLGINVKVSGMEWKVLQDTRHQKKYQVARDGWIGDYNDPMTFLDMFTTNSGNNNTNWGSTEYDNLIKKAQNSNDQSVRMPAMHKAENILMKDMPIIPIYYYTTRILKTPNLKGMIVDTLGFVYLYYSTNSK